MSEDRSASVIELAGVRAAAERYDVAILGGGLAGLTLAIDIKQHRPQTRVAVLEKREGLAPQAAFKVGESTLPTGAYYFADVVGMRDHLEQHQARKCGLRFFFSTEDNRDITLRPEGGPPTWPAHDNYQIDRGVFENELARRARGRGIDVLQGSRVGEVSLGHRDHGVAFTQFGVESSLRARWVVDAAGRASLLKRQLGLSRPVDHAINASWFRLGGGLDLEEWGAHDAEWLARTKQPGIRQFSTNHLMGEGYWVWLIPLATGPISIGVCADPRFHPFEEINEFDRLMEWLRKHEPQLAASVEPRVEDIQDFLRVEDFAYGVERVFSTDGWSLVGEAGAFADPFYSPGSDMIAYGNLFTRDLVLRDLEGEDIDERLEYFNDWFFRTFAHVLSRTEHMYPVFGNPHVLTAKIGWDTYFNHIGPALLMLRNKLTDYEFMRRVDDDVDRLYRLNINMHKLFGEWHVLAQGSLPPSFLKGFRAAREALNGVVNDYSDAELEDALHGNVRQAEAMAVALFHKAAGSLPTPPPPDRAVNPYAIGLNPDAWEADGLYEAPGLTLEEANEMAPGVDLHWPPEVPAQG